MKRFVFISLAIFITGCTKYPDLGDGYKFDSDGKYSLQIVNVENTVMISTHILKYTFDSTFIIVSQRPWDDPTISGIKEMKYYERNNAFEHSNFRQYWIINKKQKNEYIGYIKDGGYSRDKYSNVYGPFTKKEYLLCREKLGVSQKVQLAE